MPAYMFPQYETKIHAQPIASNLANFGVDQNMNSLVPLNDFIVRTSLSQLHQYLDMTEQVPTYSYAECKPAMTEMVHESTTGSLSPGVSSNSVGFSTPYEKLELKNLTSHYQKKLQEVSIKKKCQRRGRKRVNVLPAMNFNELLEKIIVPKWTEILQKKTNREGEQIGQVTDEYIWIKILRDMRDFFRIIFKSRFHRSEKREDSNRDVLVKIFLEEIGIPQSSSVNIAAVFDFLYKAHYKARSSNEGKLFKEIINSTPMRIYYYFSESAKSNFLDDDLCSRILYYFVKNFGDMYLSCIQNSLKEKTEMVMKSIVSKFSKSADF